MSGYVLWWTLTNIYSALLARLGGQVLGAPKTLNHHNTRRLCSDATGWPAAVGAASQAVPICATLVTSTTTILVVRHLAMKSRAAEELRKTQGLVITSTTSKLT